MAERRPPAASAVAGCPICLERLGEDGLVPLLLPCCGQTFCATCLRDALSRTSHCPLCRAATSIAVAVPNRALADLDAPPQEHRVLIPPYVPPVLRPPRRRSWTSRCKELYLIADRLRCVCVFVMMLFMMIFLRVEEEEFGRQTGQWRGRHIAPGGERLQLDEPDPLHRLRMRRSRARVRWSSSDEAQAEQAEQAAEAESEPHRGDG